MGRDRGIEYKSHEIAVMRRAGLVVGGTLELLRAAVRPGISTEELDAIAEDHIRSAGATPSFLGYHGFPASICASVNDEVVHGIPGDRVLAEGDVVSLDCGAIVDGWHGDAAITVAVGAVSDEVTRADAGDRGVPVARHRRGPAGRSGHRHLPRGRDPRPRQRAATASSRTTSVTASARRCTSRPTSPTTVAPAGAPARAGPGARRRADDHAGQPGDDVLDDDWTVVTTDGSWAAHFEHTFTLTPDGAWVLTALDGGEAALAALGVPYGGPVS